MIDPNPYAILGVHAGHESEDIRKAYLRAAREHHPDRGGDAGHFARLATAYATLKDAPRRQAYRARLRLLGVRCARCDGRGYTQHSQGFAGAVMVGCAVCAGAGYV